MRLIAFCEAAADFQIAAELLSRVLAGSSEKRTWHRDRECEFFDIHDVTRYLDELRVRPAYGYFDGRRGAAGAAMARNAFLIVRAMIKRGHPIDAAVLVWDMDQQPVDRKLGLTQARDNARWADFQIVLACPNIMREAWVLAGFSPVDDDEKQRHDNMRQELGFHASEHSHRLTSNDEQAKLNAKRVLRVLTDGDRGREEACWRDTSLDTLKKRGKDNGLADYLAEIEQRLR